MSLAPATAPLAARMRPATLDELVGQQHLLGPGAALRSVLDAGKTPSLLLWGPPGSGKTTLARLLAERSALRFAQLSAVTAGIKELRALLEPELGDPSGAEGRRGTLLFLDEIHRWNKSQQDALLPHVEDGSVVLIGATTENPGFQVIPALRSRCWLLVLQPLAAEDLVLLLERALEDAARGLGARRLSASPEVLGSLARAASGDARRALSFLERAAALVPDGATLTAAELAAVAGPTDLLHDATGDAHYDVASAFIKSLRGSDPDAALYWMARMLEGGDDPLFVARRMVIFAAEDIGNADVRAVGVAVAAMQGLQLIGMPEGRLLLAQACTFLAAAPKSNASYRAIDAALSLVRTTGPAPVPLHLRNAPTTLAKGLGHGAGYLYPHDHPDHIVRQDYLPPGLAGTRFYEPAPHGDEKVIGERLRWWEKRLAARAAR